MQALKLKIKNKLDMDVEKEHCIPYSYIFRSLWAHKELLEDKGFEKELLKKYNLESWSYFFDCCREEVKTKINLYETKQKNKIEYLKDLEEDLEKFLNYKRSKINSRNIFWTRRKIFELKKSIGRDITFGSRELLQKISFLSNPISKNIIKNLTEEEFKKKDEDRLEKLKEAKDLYYNKRILHVLSVGHSDTIKQKSYGNTKFKFDLKNKKIIFKPKIRVKIPIEFYCSKNQYKILCQIQESIGKIPISVRLNREYICLVFDEQKLNGYGFKKKEYIKERRLVRENKDLKNVCFKKWKREQESRMFSDKIEERYIAFDLNPEFIGFCILQKIGEKDFKILHKECVSFQNLNTKLYLSNQDKKQIKQNKKRIHELYQVWKYIFNLAKHYKVSHCCIENLNIKNSKLSIKESNIKIQNFWLRTRTTKSITKHCNTLGIKLMDDITPIYSSFIGNIKYPYFDPVNASIEIGHRGIKKYLKSSYFYPQLEGSDLDTMSQLGLDVQDKTISSWAKAYKLFQKSKLRYRRELAQANFLESNLYSHKSKVESYSFYDI